MKLPRTGATVAFTLLLMTVLATGTAFPAGSAGSRAFLSYSIDGVDGTIDGNTVTVDLTTLPVFTRADTLVAKFTTSGRSARVGAKAQVSGKTANDFTKPVTYVITAADGSTASWTVRALLSKVVAVSGYSDTLAVGSDGSLWGTGRNGGRTARDRQHRQRFEPEADHGDRRLRRCRPATITP